MEGFPASNGASVQQQPQPGTDEGGLIGDEEEEEEEEEEENVVTIKEYVDSLEEQELEVDMILGGDDGKECTYPKGYLPRQAVFSCITCCPEGNAGVCVACSMACHDGHEVIEIWTRRHFRCDCGNSKFGIGICKLFSSKDTENSENVYNQNFTGVYCTCKRPYPDPDCTEDVGEMLQCCVCEDWFHEVHLGLASADEVPRDNEGGPLFEELICQSCASSLDFLSYYDEILVPLTSVSNKEGELIGTICGETTDFAHSIVDIDGCQTSSADSLKEPSSLDSNSHPNPTVEVNINLGHERDGFDEPGTQTDINRPGCKLRPREDLSYTKGNCAIFNGKYSKDNNNGESSSIHTSSGRALFLKRNWRSELCQCDVCCGMYSKKGVSFLIDHNDTLVKYEETAKLKRKEKMEATNGHDLSFLNGLGHTGQIEFLHGLNDMTTELSAFFASREAGKAITSADIYGFFDNLKRKRARLNEQ